MKKVLLFISLFLVSLGIFSQNVSFVVDNNNGCHPLTVKATNTSDMDTTNKFYVWELYNTNNNWRLITQVENVDNDFVIDSSGNYIIRLILMDQNGFEYGSSETNINVDGLTDIKAMSGWELCPNQNGNFNINGNFNSVYWNFGNGETSDSYWVSTSYQNTGVYNIQVIAESYCGIDTVSKSIKIKNDIIPQPEIKVFSNSVCPNDMFQLMLDDNWVSYEWSFDNGKTSNAKTPYTSWNNIGNYNVIVKVSNQCGLFNNDTITINVNNSTQLNANFGIYGGSNCPYTDIQLNSSTPGSHKWYFGDGSFPIISNNYDVKYAYKDTGNYTISLVVSNSCGFHDSIAQNIKIDKDINNRPYSYMYFYDNNWEKDTISICTNEQVGFYGNYWSNYGSYTSYVWDFGDGTTSDSLLNIQHLFSQEGNHKVKFYSYNGCGTSDTTTKIVIVSTDKIPQNNIQILPQMICKGENVFFVDEDFNGNGNFTYSIWFGDGDSAIDIMNYGDSLIPIIKRHKYTETGTYLFTINVKNQCGNTQVIKDTIWVSNSGVDPFYYIENSTFSDNGDDRSKCPGDLINFMSVGGLHRTWHFYDGTTDTNEVVYKVYDSVGVYNEYVIATNGCGRIDTIPSIVTIKTTNLPDSWLNLEKETVCLGEIFSLRYPNSEENGDNELNPYTYHWDFGDNHTTTGLIQNYTYNTSGNFNINLEVSNGCGSKTTSMSINVVSPEASFNVLNNTVILSTPATFSNNSSNASAYLWNFDDGNTSTEYNPTHTYTQTGNYNVSLTAYTYLGCAKTYTYPSTIDVIELTTPVINVKEYSDITCFGSNDGHIEIEMTGGLPPFTYNWSNGGHNSSISNLTKGSYKITVIDSYNQTVIDSFMVEEPELLTSSLTTTNITCNGFNDGIITTSTSGGTLPYSYKWSNNLTTANLSNLAKGKYIITITDLNSCILIDSTEIMEPTPIIIDAIITNASCQNADGKIVITATGGSNNFTYLWDLQPIQTNDTLSNIYAGHYNFTLTDTLNNCIKQKEFYVGNIGAPSIDSIIVKDISCYGANNGNAKIFASGGVEPYSYEWSHNNAIDTNYVSDLTNNNYIVTVSDANGCISLDVFTITQPNELKVQINLLKGLDCYYSCDGSIYTNVTGGTFPFTYTWNVFYDANNDTIKNICSGKYNITVKDINNCIALDSFNLTAPDTLYATSEIRDIYEDSLGMINVTIHNATPPYNYAWSAIGFSYTGKDTNIIDSLNIAGKYKLLITDSKGCYISDTFDVAMIDYISKIETQNAFINIYPVPAKEIINISYNLPDNSKPINIEITDILGRNTNLYDIPSDNNNIITINTNNLPNGIYIVKLRTNNAIISKQISILK
ncbi:MAG: hypothetical protein A2X12_01180 [Bacteroidetes bacterium GWE2_29_8]|nr:MAG: hypothetical protein A2X12_01180 [Bacteroidetes bacterium GWE2_29_8]